MENKKIAQKVHQSLKNIAFVPRYKAIMSSHNHKRDEILSKMNKSNILNAFKRLGYSFKISSPGQFYVYIEKMEHISLKLSMQISGGMITSYLYVYENDHIIDLEETNFAFIYRHMLGNMEEETNAPKFKDYIELEQILKKILDLYESFKTEFQHELGVSGQN